MKKLLYLIANEQYFISHRLDLARAASAHLDIHLAAELNPTTQHDFYTCHTLPIDRSSLNPIKTLISSYQLYKLLATIKPDLLHLVALKPILVGNLAALFFPRTKIIASFTGLGYLYTQPALKDRLINKLLLYVFKILFKLNTTEIIVQNQDDEAFFLKNHLVAPERLHLIRGSGVDLNLFTPTDKKTHTPLIALCAARALKDKGITELAEAGRLLKERNIPLQIHLAGTPDPQNPTSIPESQLRAWDEVGILTWLGFQSDMPALLKSADIAVLPSYREGLPKSLLEAAAAGLPLVATDVPGCREICHEGVNGFLVPARNAVALADALEKLALNPELRKTMGLASRQLVEGELGMEMVNKKTLAVYGVRTSSRA